MQNKIMAVHNPGGREEGNGVWLFTCYAHEPDEMQLQAISSPKHSLEVMKKHCDEEHAGVHMSVSRDSSYSGSYRSAYTGKAKEGAKK